MINQRPHKKPKVWQKAVELFIGIYELSKSFPREEEFGSKSQLRRASVSVPSNIAEGLTRKSIRDKLHFLIADSSLSEIDTQLEKTNRLGMVDNREFAETESALMEVQRLLSGLIQSIAS